MTQRKKAAVAIDKWLAEKQYPTATMWAQSATNYDVRIEVLEAILEVVEIVIPAAVDIAVRRIDEQR